MVSKCEPNKNKSRAFTEDRMEFVFEKFGASFLAQQIKIIKSFPTKQDYVSGEMM
jgi:hypothetical protein